MEEIMIKWTEYFPDEFSHAPCYYHLPDDGASMKCSDCKKDFNPTELIWTFTPNGLAPEVFCMECIDEDWIKNAKDMGVTKR
jgi:hypothetical protein